MHLVGDLELEPQSTRPPSGLLSCAMPRARTDDCSSLWGRHLREGRRANQLPTGRVGRHPRESLPAFQIA
jgi:hypothetical protein